jgi:hypothetical protein
MRRREAGRTGGRAGDAARKPVAGLPPAGAAPAREPSHGSHPGGFGTRPGGTTAPVRGASLTARFIAGHASADRSWAKAERHSPEPRQSVERRAGLRHWPVISGDPEMDPTARRVTGCGDPHQRLSALCSPHFFRGAETDKGHPAPHQTGRRSFGQSAGSIGQSAGSTTERDDMLARIPALMDIRLDGRG